MAPRSASPGPGRPRPGLAAVAVLVAALAVARLEGVAADAADGRQPPSSSSSALLSRDVDVDVVVAESPVTLGTTTDATVASTSPPSSTPPAEDGGGQQGRPGLADVVKARLGEQPPPLRAARTLVLLSDNATASLHADHVFGERGAKAIRFGSKRANGLEPGLLRLTPAVQPANASSSAAMTALQPAQPSEQPSAWSALSGIVSDCLLGFSASCLQRKLLIFVNRLSRMERVNLLGSYVSLVRVTEDAPPPISEHVLEARIVDDEDDAETALEALMQHNVDSFIESHVLRFQLPSWFSSAIGGPSVGTGRDAADAVDLDLEDIVETRQKGGGKGGKPPKIIKKIKKKKKKQSKSRSKMMKKMMKGMTKMGGMMMFGMLGKTAMLAPLLGMLGTLSLKLSTIALLIAKVMLLRSVFSGGLGSIPGLSGGKGGLSNLLSGFGGGSQQPSSGYGAPAPQQLSSGYGAPTPQQPSSGYGAPQPSFTPPTSTGFRPPTSSYGAPAPVSTPQFTPPSTSYGTPTASYSQPFRPPSSDYGAPTGGSYFPSGGAASSAGSSSSSSSLFGGGGGGASSSSSSGSSASSGLFGASGGQGGQGGYVGGGANWVNRRGWDAHALAYGAYLQEPEMHTTTEPIL